MPRQSKQSGKYIFSASEVAEFVLCPQSWYLSRIEKVNPSDELSEKIIEGEKLHKEWAEYYAEGLSLSRLLRWLVALITACIVVLLVRYS